MDYFSSLYSFQQWLDSYLNFERTPKKNIFWLDTMRFLCARFNHPEQTFAAVHTAGSKGKGSACAMTASILNQAKYKCGIYASPHISSFAERIRTPDGFYPESVYNAAANEIIHGVESIPIRQFPEERVPTWFELVTLYAFLCFRQTSADWGVIETGLGGRLDATNILTPAACMLTPIEMEHTEYLGNTITKIAEEKAGIIKKNTPVCISPQNQEVYEVFKRRAGECGAPILMLEQEVPKINCAVTAGGTHIQFRSSYFKQPIETTLKMQGVFQAQNAALAALTVKTIIPDISETDIEYGLAAAALPGRFEITKKTESAPELVLDGAHTVNSIRYTLDTLSAVYPKKHFNRHLLFACAADKDAEHMAQLCSGFSRITLTRPGSIKEANLDEIQNAFAKTSFNYIVCEDHIQAIRNALMHAKHENAVLLVAGSFYLVAEVKAFLQNHLSDLS